MDFLLEVLGAIWPTLAGAAVVAFLVGMFGDPPPGWWRGR